MTALTDADLARARETVAACRPLSPTLGDALIREALRLRRVVAGERAEGAAQFAESNRLAIALDAIRATADAALSDDVSPAPGTRTPTRSAVR